MARPVDKTGQYLTHDRYLEIAQPEDDPVALPSFFLSCNACGTRFKRVGPRVDMKDFKRHKIVCRSRWWAEYHRRRATERSIEEVYID